jgi:hypothetical protein
MLSWTRRFGPTPRPTWLPDWALLYRLGLANSLVTVSSSELKTDMSFSVRLLVVLASLSSFT